MLFSLAKLRRSAAETVLYNDTCCSAVSKGRNSPKVFSFRAHNEIAQGILHSFKKTHTYTKAPKDVVVSIFLGMRREAELGSN